MLLPDPEQRLCVCVCVCVFWGGVGFIVYLCARYQRFFRSVSWQCAPIKQSTCLLYFTQTERLRGAGGEGGVRISNKGRLYIRISLVCLGETESHSREPLFVQRCVDGYLSLPSSSSSSSSSTATLQLSLGAAYSHYDRYRCVDCDVASINTDQSVGTQCTRCVGNVTVYRLI